MYNRNIRPVFAVDLAFFFCFSFSFVFRGVILFPLATFSGFPKIFKSLRSVTILSAVLVYSLSF